jgi:hypothetical protein
MYSATERHKYDYAVMSAKNEQHGIPRSKNHGFSDEGGGDMISLFNRCERQNL